MEGWRSISYCRSSIQLRPVLLAGQSFRWKCLKEDHYIGVFQNKVWQLIQTDIDIKYKTHENQDQSTEERQLRSYLNLDINLPQLYNKWSEKDSHFVEAAKRFYGVRMLQQDVIENVFSFICSSNNNIERIKLMVEKLCNLYGTYLTTIDDVAYHGFPNVAALVAPNVEKKLRQAGFGYRASYIVKSAISINNVGEEKWVGYLRNLDYPGARKELTSLTGIGRKVADCICLMSLNHMQAVPVDTHILQIAVRNYLPHLKQRKALTDKLYDEVADFFRDLFGPYAGWAQTILFCDDLKSNQNKKRPEKSQTATKLKKTKC